MTWADELIESVRNRNREFSKTRDIAEQVKRLTATAKNDQRGIEIIVGTDGKVEGIKLSAAALKLRPNDLSAEILRLVQVAQSNYARLLEQVNSEVLGDSELSRIIAERIRRNYPEEPDEAHPEAQNLKDPHNTKTNTPWEQDAAHRGFQDEDEDEEWTWRR